MDLDKLKDQWQNANNSENKKLKNFEDFTSIIVKRQKHIQSNILRTILFEMLISILACAVIIYLFLGRDDFFIGLVIAIFAFITSFFYLWHYKLIKQTGQEANIKLALESTIFRFKRYIKYYKLSLLSVIFLTPAIFILLFIYDMWNYNFWLGLGGFMLYGVVVYGLAIGVLHLVYDRKIKRLEHLYFELLNGKQE